MAVRSKVLTPSVGVLPPSSSSHESISKGPAPSSGGDTTERAKDDTLAQPVRPFCTRTHTVPPPLT